jgi:hypothetical protein
MVDRSPTPARDSAPKIAFSLAVSFFSSIGNAATFNSSAMSQSCDIARRTAAARRTWGARPP